VAVGGDMTWQCQCHPAASRHPLFQQGCYVCGAVRPDLRAPIDRIPEHMRRSLTDWVERGVPHPARMGSFFRAVLTNDLKRAVMCADDRNRAALIDWAIYLHNEVPALAHGSEERLLEWHRRGGLLGGRGGETA